MLEIRSDCFVKRQVQWKRLKCQLLSKAALVPIVIGISISSAYAQAHGPSAEASAVEDTEVSSSNSRAAGLEDAIVVTGSRIARDGYSAPTPISVISSEQLTSTTPTNLPDAINKMPQFFNSSGQATGLTNADRPYAGNYLNLRGVGAQRVLVLMDGHRVPPTSYEGSVDTNLLPQLLIDRVEVVTGGASAIYGSDAVSGVVNFVLDKKFVGLKGVAQSGISQRGDNATHRLGVAGGLNFAGDRGHMIASIEHFKSNGIPRKNDRAGQSRNALYLGQGTEADPFKIYDNATFNVVARGGYVTNGPFAGQQFVPGGHLAPFDPGNVISGILSAGGDGAAGTGNTVLVAGLKTTQAFARASYEISDAVEVYVQGSYADSKNSYNALENNFRFGVPIYSGNAFLAPEVQAILTANNTASFNINRGHDRTEPLTAVDTKNTAWNATVGAEGRIGDTLSWEVYYTHGDTKLKTRRNESENSKFFAAIDAVDEGQFNGGAANGNIVCRVALTHPGLYPGCTPLNLFGEGSASADALAYVDGITIFDVRNKLDEVSGNIQGELFPLWSQPISFSVGASYRKQSLEQVSNADPAVALDYTGIRGISPSAARFVYTNVGSANGSYNVKEAFGELVIPIVSDIPMVRDLELNGAARLTKYSTTKSEVTWKMGFSYSPIDDIRFRGTMSRDIRAPTLFDFFAGRFFNSTVFSDPLTGGTAVMPTFGGGNLELEAEVGKTKTIGVIVRPSFLDGFSFSADWYELKIVDAISTLSANTIASRCHASGGTDPLCSRIDRPFDYSNMTAANFPRSIDISPVNLASITTRGVDFDATYVIPVGDASVSLNAYLSYVYDYITDSGLGSPALQQAGTNVTLSEAYPKVRGTFNISYSDESFGAHLQGRYVGSTKLTNLVPGAVFDPPRAPSAVYFDATIEGKVELPGGGHFTPFFTVSNLFDKSPPFVPARTNPGISFPTTLALYDVIGRQFTAGVRFEF